MCDDESTSLVSLEVILASKSVQSLLMVRLALATKDTSFMMAETARDLAGIDKPEDIAVDW